MALKYSYLRTFRGTLKVASIVIQSFITGCALLSYVNTYCHSQSPAGHRPWASVLRMCTNGYEQHEHGWIIFLWFLFSLLIVILSIIGLICTVKKPKKLEKLIPWRLASAIYNVLAVLVVHIAAVESFYVWYSIFRKIQSDNYYFWCIMTRKWYVGDCFPPKTIPLLTGVCFSGLNCAIYIATAVLELVNRPQPPKDNDGK